MSTNNPVRPVAAAANPPVPASGLALENSASGVSWSAVIAGGFATAALTTLLMALGAGMGLSSMSPWPSAGVSVHGVAAGAILWIIIVQLLSCALGGYLAGRLRSRWVAVHGHEVYFRDTAHGLLVWAVSLVLGVAFLSTLATSITKDLAGVAQDTQTNPATYFSDALFRTTQPTPAVMTPELRSETTAILARGLAQNETAEADKAYLASLVAARTGLSETDAARRVDQVLTAEREAADQARKAIAHSLYWLVVALLVGAFAASYAAIYGGKRRDYVWR